MKIVQKVFLLTLCLLLSTISMAQSTIAGTWAGKLEVAPGNKISVHFALSQDASGAWSAVLNSPDMGAIKNVKANSVSFDGKKLDIKVDALSGAYSGMLNNGSFEGQWTQPGSTLVMQLSPYTASVLSDAAKAVLLGQWHGKLKAPGVTLNIVLFFEKNAAGEFVSLFQSVDQSPTKVDIADLNFDNNELFFRVPKIQGEYRATLTGSFFSGSWKQAQQTMELNIEKGEYVAEKITLALTEADYSKLQGKWTGTLGPLTLVMRFEKATDGTIAAFLDSPNQKATGLKITQASLKENHLDVALTVPPAQFSGDLKEGTLTGSWIQGGKNQPLSLKRE